MCAHTRVHTQVRTHLGVDGVVDAVEEDRVPLLSLHRHNMHARPCPCLRLLLVVVVVDGQAPHAHVHFDLQFGRLCERTGKRVYVHSSMRRHDSTTSHMRHGTTMTAHAFRHTTRALAAVSGTSARIMHRSSASRPTAGGRIVPVCKFVCWGPMGWVDVSFMCVWMSELTHVGFVAFIYDTCTHVHPFYLPYRVIHPHPRGRRAASSAGTFTQHPHL